MRMVLEDEIDDQSGPDRHRRDQKDSDATARRERDGDAEAAQQIGQSEAQQTNGVTRKNSRAARAKRVVVEKPPEP